MTPRRMLAGLLPALAILAAAAPSAHADVASTPGGFDLGGGDLKTCTTGPAGGVQGQNGAWGAFVDGCTVRVRCSFAEGCTVGGRGVIQDEAFGGRRVTLNARLRLLDRRGRITQKRWDNSCDGRNFCVAGLVDRYLPKGDVASVQCNGVHEAAAGSARVTCLIQATRGYEFTALRGGTAQRCPDADTPVTQLSQHAAEMAVLCVTNYQRRGAGLPGLTYNQALTNAAAGHATDAVNAPEQWWTGNDAHHNPFTNTDPPDRIAAAGYCPAAKYLDLGRPENAYTSGSSGNYPVATPRDAVRWWMTHHIAEGRPASENGHRAAILNPAAMEIGNGVVIGEAMKDVTADTGGTFVQTFGTCIS